MLVIVRMRMRTEHDEHWHDEDDGVGRWCCTRRRETRRDRYPDTVPAVAVELSHRGRDERVWPRPATLSRYCCSPWWTLDGGRGAVLGDVFDFEFVENRRRCETADTALKTLVTRIAGSNAVFLPRAFLVCILLARFSDWVSRTNAGGDGRKISELLIASRILCSKHDRDRDRCVTKKRLKAGLKRTIQAAPPAAAVFSLAFSIQRRTERQKKSSHTLLLALVSSP